MKWFDDEIDKEFERMRRRMEQTFGALRRQTAATLLSDSGWRPQMDLYETDGDYVVLVALAGMKPEELEVVVDRDTLRISGNRCRPLSQGIIKVHQMEIDFGPFSQTIRLPEAVDSNRASSTYRDGFLTVRLPKQSKVTATISVTVEE
ncbi:MAG: Hsp20/alpha crystallin family protein [Deltaproteobacteria bacterium]|nr:Hsp20/alpha crystallin family protein [Deltaproteobacteria bacterium]MBW2071637.1 Hsp20/alpha crystallin family protein [Deltaproteobacteria bacterium]